MLIQNILIWQRNISLYTPYLRKQIGIMTVILTLRLVLILSLTIIGTQSFAIKNSHN
jgi:hypothetical protein